MPILCFTVDHHECGNRPPACLLLLVACCLVFLAVRPMRAVALTTSDRIAVITDQLGYFPCMDCHGDQATYSQPRILEEEHSDPLYYTDENGVVHEITFGERVPIADLLDSSRPGDLSSDLVARVGKSVRIRQYMEFNGLAPTDSVWVLLHGGGNIWCLNCHDEPDRDKLIKLNGEKLTFNQSHLLCGECHGPELHDWEQGIHGKTTGYWNLDLDREETSIRKLCVECHNPHAPAFPAMQALPPPVSRLPRRHAGTPGHADGAAQATARKHESPDHE